MPLSRLKCPYHVIVIVILIVIVFVIEHVYDHDQDHENDEENGVLRHGIISPMIIPS